MCFTQKDNPTDLPVRRLSPLHRYPDYLCGLGQWTPNWLQSFADSRWFLLLHSCLGTVQAMATIYFAGTLTTIERRFGLQSKTSGWMMIGNEMSEILMTPFLAYFGGQGNRPKWISWGVIFSALSCYALASPHLFFGPGPEALLHTLESDDNNSSHLPSEKGVGVKKQGLCTADPQPPDCSPGEEAVLTPLLIFFSQFILGIGNTLYYSLGQPYMDDNSKTEDSPLYLGTSLAMRAIGVTLGFFVTYSCLLTYIDPMVTPTISPSDPRWLGAWWLGWLILGTVMMVLGFLVSLFPKELKRPLKQETRKPLTGSPTHQPALKHTRNLPPKAKDFLPRLMKLLKNKLLMVNMFSGVFYVLSETGNVAFMTRNQEITWFQDSAHSNIIIGPLVMGGMAAAFVYSGWVISRYKPKPTLVLGWNVFTGLLIVLFHASLPFFACPDIDIAGFDPLTKQFTLVNECNADCSCETVSFSPVCLIERRLTFASPCHAGCTGSARDEQLNARTHLYSNCSCVPSGQDYSLQSEYQTYSGTAMDGYCLPDCGYSQHYCVLLTFVIQFLGTSGKVGNVLINYRAVEPEDKSFSAGIGIFVISLFAFMPGPVIFGYVVDASCLLWDTRCGPQGSCLYYDRWLFRLYLNGTSVLLLGIGVVLDGMVMYLGRNIDLYEEDELRTRKITICREMEVLNSSSST